MSFQVALSFEDGVTQFVTCDDNQTVADAAYQQRINIPVDCNDGACGTCKALCESGDFDGGSYIEDALTEQEAAEGYCLPCQVKPRSDVVLRIASTSAVAKTSASTFTATVTDIRRYSPTTIGFTIEIANRHDLVFLPGQYVNIQVPGTDVTRSYSFSSGPTDEELSFLVKLVDKGIMSTWLRDTAHIGDTFTFTGPHGSFFLRDAQQPILLLAGGTGLASVLSILRTLRANNSDRTIHLIYGATTDDDVIELATLSQLSSEISGFTWDYVVADPATTAPHQGFVTSLMTPEHLYGGDAAIYLCGPPPMVEAVRRHLRDLAVAPVGFYFEKFTNASTTAESSDTVSTKATVTVPREKADADVASTSVKTLSRSLMVSPRLATSEETPTTTFAGDSGHDVAGQATFPAIREVAGQQIFPRSDLPSSERLVSGADHASGGRSDPATNADRTADLYKARFIGPAFPNRYSTWRADRDRCARDAGARDLPAAGGKRSKACHQRGFPSADWSDSPSGEGYGRVHPVKRAPKGATAQ